MVQRLRSFLRNLLMRRRAEHALDDEVRSCVEILADQKVARGMTPEEARRRALVELDGVEQVKEHVRWGRSGAFIDGMRQDFGYALRRLARERLFAGLCVGTLALGIGVVAAAFAVVDAVLLQPIVPHQDRVFRFWKSDPIRNDFRHPLSYVEFRALREHSQSFEILAAVRYSDVETRAIAFDDQLAVVRIAAVSPEFLPLSTDRTPLHGKWFGADDDQGEGDIAAVVSVGLWRRIAAGDLDLIGRRLRLIDGRHLVVVGIAPDNALYPIGSDIWVPIGRYFYRAFGGRGAENPDFALFELVGRLKPQVSLQQARSELEVHSRTFVAENDKSPRTMNVVATPLIETVVGLGREALLFILGGACLVLFVAGVNVAALLLMRASRQRREQAVRLALGATRLRLLRALAADSLVLGILATAAGIGLAFALLQLARWLDPGSLPRLADATIDARALLLMSGVSLFWVVTLGTAPAWASRSVNPARVGDLSSRNQPATRGLGLFTIAETAVALVVVIVAGLLLRSLVQLQSIDRGFEPENLAVIPVMTPEDRYKDAPSRVALYRDLLSRIEALPGVVSATTIHMNPGTGSGGLSSTPLFEGQSEDEAESNPWASFDAITPSYFPTIGVPILEGRNFQDSDRRDAEPVVIVSESIARRYWPGQNAIGKRLRFTKDSPWSTVVGVAGEMRYRELTRTWMAVYFPADQFFFYQPQAILVRTASSTAAVIPSVRSAIQAREPGMAVDAATTMDALLASDVARPRATFAVMLLFAAMTLVLAIVGVYGVLSYDVSQRRRELAVRSALGASPTRLFGSVAWRSVRLGAAGTSIGLATALVGARALEPLLFEVRPVDPMTFVTAAGVLLAAATLAAVAPGTRAARSAPADVMREG